MKQDVYNLEGKKTGQAELGREVFGLEIDADLVHQTAVALEANKRKGTAHSKTRGEVRGGGRKPWKQKGTGNARTGSIRNPIFRGGGITFGPRNEVNFSKKINKKVRRKAFLMALSGKAADKELRVIQEFSLEKPSTKKLAGLIKQMKAEGKSILMVSQKKNVNLGKSLGNIKRANYGLAAGINTLDLLNNKYLFLDELAVQYYNGKYGVGKTAAVKRTRKGKAKSKSKQTKK